MIIPGKQRLVPGAWYIKNGSYYEYGSFMATSYYGQQKRFAAINTFSNEWLYSSLANVVPRGPTAYYL